LKIRFLYYFLETGYWKFDISFNRVPPALIKGVATQDPPQGHQTALNDPVFFNGGVGVFRASRLKPAITVGKKMFGDSVVKRQGLLV
jgi:hypothetical protein